MLEKKKQITAMEFTVIEKIQLAMLTTVVVLTILVLKMMAKHEDTAARGDVGDDDGASSARSLILPRSPSTVTISIVVLKTAKNAIIIVSILCRSISCTSLNRLFLRSGCW